MPSRIGLRELRAAAKPGECPFCGDPIPTVKAGKGYLYCGDKECFIAYHRYYKRDIRQSSRRAVVGRKYRPSRGPVDKLVLFSEELECGHIRLYSPTGDRPSEVRLCRECLLDKQN